MGRGVWKQWILQASGKLLLLGFGLSVGFGFGEIALRLVAPQAVWQWRPGPFVEDGEGFFRLRPGLRSVSENRVEFKHQVQINSLGLRGPEPEPTPEATADGACRILAIGDSFTFGVGVEGAEVFHQVAARRLSEQGIPTRALNGGIPAIGVPRAIRWLANHGLSSEPDWVLLSVFVGNDLQDASADYAWTVEAGQLVIAGQSQGLKEWLYQHSNLYVFLKKSSLLQGLQRRLGRAEPWSLRSARQGFAIYHATPTATVEEGLRRTDEALGEWLQLAEQHGFRVAATLIPDVLQVDDERWQGALRQLALAPGEHDPRQPNRLLRALFERRGIPLLDLTPAFDVGFDRGEDLYFSIDRHWTPAGHALAGAEVASFLHSLGVCSPVGSPPPGG